MSHLTSETLARLVDESPTADERLHLDACISCRDALDGLRAQTAALRSLPPLAPPAAAWEQIASRVNAERALSSRRQPVSGAFMRAAAAVIVFALGTATGIALSRDRTATPSAPVDRAGAGAAPTRVSAPMTPEAALARLRIAEMMYTGALLDYAALTSPQPPEDAVARLATLETIVLTTRTALERAPADPLINSYHLAALAERQTLLGQLRRAPETKQWY